MNTESTATVLLFTSVHLVILMSAPVISCDVTSWTVAFSEKKPFLNFNLPGSFNVYICVLFKDLFFRHSYGWE